MIGALLTVGLIQGTLASASSRSPGDLDPTFGSGGTVSTGFEGTQPDNLYSNAVAAQSDGNIIVAGGTGPANLPGARNGPVLVRYDADGSLDPTFGSGGIAEPNLGDAGEVNDLTLLANGRILGVASKPGSDVTTLTRLQPDGSLDASFGNGGDATIDLGDGAVGTGVALQPDGKVVVAGTGAVDSPSNPQTELVLARFDAAGSLDTSFGTSGVVRTTFGAGGFSHTGLAIQPDGEIVATTFSAGGTVVARFQADGSLDPGFGAGGTVETTRAAFSNDPLIQPDGKIVVGGASGGITLLRLNPDGTSDASFGTNGVAEFRGSGCCGSDKGAGLALQADGKIVASGDLAYENRADFAAVRFNGDGTPDTTFGSGGESSTDLGPADFEQVSGVVLTTGGRVVVAGDFGDCLVFHFPACRAISNDLGLVGFTAGGSTDPGFGTGGAVTTSLGDTTVPASAEVRAIAVQPDHGIVAVGTWHSLTDNGLALARYMPGGSLDPSFGNGGKEMLELKPRIEGAMAEGDGTIVVAERRGLQAFNPDGSADPSFGAAGGFVPISNLDGATSDSKGRLLTVSGNPHDIGGVKLSRWHADGSPDPRFGTQGAVALSKSSGPLYSVVVQGDGRIIVAGSRAMAAIFPSGALDKRFGDRGYVSYSRRRVGGIFGALGTGRGSILLYGRWGDTRVALDRFRPDGAIDRSFGRNGRALGPPSTPLRGTAVVQPGGKIDASVKAPGKAIGVLRFKRNGSVDRSFGSNGVASTGAEGAAIAAAIAPGRILVAGGSFSFFLAAFLR